MSTIVWLAAMVIFLALEAATVSLVSIWFAAASLAAMIVGWIHGPLWLQITVFLLVSAGCLLALRPLVRRYFTPRLVKTNVDSTAGQRGYVIAEISNEKATGRVRLGAMEWTARSSAGQVIPEGTLVQVDKVEGVKVFVTPVDETINV